MGTTSFHGSSRSGTSVVPRGGVLAGVELDRRRVEGAGATRRRGRVCPDAGWAFVTATLV